MPYYAFDTETYLIERGRAVPRLVCASVYPVPPGIPSGAMRVDGGALLGASDAAAWYTKALSDRDTTLILHNASFDLLVMIEAVATRFPPYRDLWAATWSAVRSGRIRDTMVRAMLIDIATGEMHKGSRYSLAHLAKKHLDRDLSGGKKKDAWRYRYSELDGVPLAKWPEGATKYPISDVAATWDLHLDQARPRTSSSGDTIVGSTGVVDEVPQVAASLALGLCGATGVRTDPIATEALRRAVQSEVDRGTAAGQAAGFVRPSGSRIMVELRARVDRAYLGTAPSTPKGSTRTDRDTLLASGDASLIEYARSGKARKILTTYIPILEKGVSWPITSRPLVLKRTGRTGWTDPSLQHGPREGAYRSCYVPRPGYRFVACDYHSAESRALAQLHLWLGLGDTVARALREGRDLHLHVAAEIVGCSYATAVLRYQAGDKDVAAGRQFAKVLNFGLPGGMGVDRLVDSARKAGLSLDKARARELKESWLRAWPEMRRYFALVAQKAKWGTFDMKHPISNRVRGGVGFCDGCNSLFQGLIADGAKSALVQVATEATTPGSALYGARPWVFLHDEIVIEAPIPLVSEAATRLEHVMISSMRRYLPDVPVLATAKIMDRWAK